MKWLICLIVSLPTLAWGGAAAATELFSVRCDGGDPERPYFATFDLAAKAVVFETPPSNPETYGGSNIYAGTVSSTDYGQVAFSLRNVSRRIDLVFKQNDKTMIWPGFDEAPFRPTLTHRCTVMPPRSILSFRVRAPIENPVSVRCEDAGYMYFTMDTATKRALFERGNEGRTFFGEVTEFDGDETRLLMSFDTPSRVTWSRSRETITVESVPGDPARPGIVMQCQEVAQRSMMIWHGKLDRW